ncbi:hypothetical protein [Streptomyces mirabilis]|uniref:hypothetical protein n=1 Tax=Streptomyces mirabilis TaxID=68239 RepID=UPI003325E692
MRFVVARYEKDADSPDSVTDLSTVDVNAVSAMLGVPGAELTVLSRGLGRLRVGAHREEKRPGAARRQGGTRPSCCGPRGSAHVDVVTGGVDRGERA